MNNRREEWMRKAGSVSGGRNEKKDRYQTISHRNQFDFVAFFALFDGISGWVYLHLIHTSSTPLLPHPLLIPHAFLASFLGWYFA